MHFVEERSIQVRNTLAVEGSHDPDESEQRQTEIPAEYRSKLMKLFPIITAAVTIFAMSTVARADYQAPADHGTETGQPEGAAEQAEGFGKMFVSGTATLLLNPRVKLKGGGVSASTSYRFGGGFNAMFEYYVWDYIAVGGGMHLKTWKPKGRGARTSLSFSIDPSVRGLYAFGPNKSLEPFVRFAFGYTAFIPHKDLEGVDTEHGWNIKIGPGFKYTLPMGLAFIGEFGYFHSSYKSDGITGTPSSFYMDFGVGYHF